MPGVHAHRIADGHRHHPGAGRAGARSSGQRPTKGATARATAEIQALSSAANNYQIDNGTYPRVLHASSATKNTDDLDAKTKYDPVATTSPSYSDTSLILYQLLSGAFYFDSSSGGPKPWPGSASPTPAKPTVYFPFKDSQLKGAPSSGYVDPTTVTAIIDPFGFSYGYSTAYQADIDAGTPNPPTHGYNPTFDLWSTAGYTAASSGGKSYPGAPMTSATYYTLWIKNW